MRTAAGLQFVVRCAVDLGFTRDRQFIVPKPARVDLGGGALAARIADFQQAIRAFGFTASAAGACIGSGKHRTVRFFFTEWPPDWHERYMAQGWLDDDFVVAESHRRISPFRWDEVLAERKLSRREAEIYDAAREYGWREVFAVPVHGPAGYSGLVVLASTAVLTLSIEDRAVLQLMAMAMHERCRSAIRFANAEHARIRLTRRERECLQWVAAGKSDNEIGALIGISPSTAHYHVEKAKKKLGTKSRAAAVATLVLQGEI